MLVVAAGLVVGCKAGTGVKRAPGEPRSTKEADAMWALAPAGAQSGFVASPRGLELAYQALRIVRGLKQKLPMLEGVIAEIDRVQPVAGQMQPAAVGWTLSKAAALFFTESGWVAVLPIGDRSTFLQAVDGTAGASPEAGDLVGDATCKQLGEVYACARPATLLTTLGQGDLRSELVQVGARGDLELVDSAPPFDFSPSRIAAVVQLERGAVTVRGSLRNAPAWLRGKLGAAAQLSEETRSTAGFIALDLRPLLVRLPDVPVLPGLTMRQLVRSINGPMAMTIPPGDELMVDARVPLSDPAPFAALVRRCGELPGSEAFAKVQGDTCHLTIPELSSPMAIDLWVEGSTLRFGKRNGVAVGKSAIRTSIGDELASGVWALALWGRGAMFRSFPVSLAPGIKESGNGDAIALNMQSEVIRVMMLISEVGLGARVDGDAVRFAASLRTVFANPDDVVAKIFAVSPDEIAAGRGLAVADRIAAGANSALFVTDHAAGQGGLIFPVGIIAGLGVPLLMDALKPPRKSESEGQLHHLGEMAKRYHAEHARLPIGETALTPAIDCCTQNFKGKKTCAAEAATWQAQVWKELDFHLDEPHYFRYSYKSDGKTFVATAVGDLDCDTQPITYQLRGEVVGGKLETELTPPPPNTD
jgi:hypothetical protein